MSHTETRIQTMFAAALLLLCSLSLPLSSCREKTVGEKVGDKIDDATDQRPAEKVRDAVEDARN
ncbi:MAG TPA: hypothetical protein VD994_17350 [Prosthecobacter sp.]|nr:hypothetical protein [Prosthecobacter sp.]